MRLFVLRHGETEWNRVGRLQGHGDSPLTPLGVAQASACARLLASELGDPAHAWLVASPLGRARQTAEILRAEIPFQPERCSESKLLAEHHMGRWEGLTWAEIEQRFPGEQDRRRADKWGYVVPGGESYALLHARLEPWLRAQRQGETVVVVAHAMVSRVLRGTFLGLAAPALVELPNHGHGQICVLEGAGCRVLQAEVPPAA